MILGGFSTKCLHEGGCCINGGMNFVPPVLLRLKRGSCLPALPMWEELFRYTDKDEDWEFGVERTRKLDLRQKRCFRLEDSSLLCQDSSRCAREHDHSPGEASEFAE